MLDLDKILALIEVMTNEDSPSVVAVNQRQSNVFAERKRD